MGMFFTVRTDVDGKKGETDCCYMVMMPSCVGCFQGEYDRMATETKDLSNVVSTEPKAKVAAFTGIADDSD